MLVSAIACNTDASPPEAASIVNTVLYKQNGGDPNDYRDINVADRVLAYRPKPKSKPAKKRARQRKKIQRESCI